MRTSAVMKVRYGDRKAQHDGRRSLMTCDSVSSASKQCSADREIRRSTPRGSAAFRSGRVLLEVESCDVTSDDDGGRYVSYHPHHRGVRTTTN